VIRTLDACIESERSVIKRLYHMLSLLALTHLFALSGLVAYLFATGRLNEKRIEQLAEVLRGEYPEPAPATQPAEEPDLPVPSAGEIERMQARAEYRDLVAARRNDEKEDRNILEERTWLELKRLQAELEDKIKSFNKQKETFTGDLNQKGFDNVLETLSSIEPEKARDLLMKHGGFKDADVVRIMMAMDPFRDKKIVNACQTPEELAWMGSIQRQIYELNEKSTDGVDGPEVATSGGP